MILSRLIQVPDDAKLTRVNVWSLCFRVVSSVVAALGAHVICGRIPGLTPRQRDLCRASPDAIAAVSEGARVGTLECRFQFRHHRWNCSTIGSDAIFGHVMVVGK
jgi:wingless-type MMTV integration site family, member 7